MSLVKVEVLANVSYVPEGKSFADVARPPEKISVSDAIADSLVERGLAKRAR